MGVLVKDKPEPDSQSLLELHFHITPFSALIILSSDYSQL